MQNLKLKNDFINSTIMIYSDRTVNYSIKQTTAQILTNSHSEVILNFMNFVNDHKKQ